MENRMRSMLGSFVGDAAGATLELYGNTITEEMALKAMKMPGGGYFAVGPGQITDDGELTLTIWNTLCAGKYNPADGYPIRKIIIAYFTWYNSKPFDIGRTCSSAFHEYFKSFECEWVDDDRLLQIRRNVWKLTRHSEANGALMRATSIATWVAFHPSAISAEAGAQIAMEDASLSHPNIICQEANAIYVFAIIHLLRGVSPADVLAYTDEFVRMNDFSEKIQKWYFEESLSIDGMDCTKNIGHVRWGFVLAFYFLRNYAIGFEDAIRTVLMKGGDTDTNAAIVGGLVGCYQEIPVYMMNAVLEFDCTTQGQIRPSMYSVKAAVASAVAAAATI